MKLKILLLAILTLAFGWAGAQTIEQGRTIGGSGADNSIRTVKDGDFIYVLGETKSPNFPSTDGSVYNPGGGTSAQDMTITKIDGLTGNIVFSKIIGGSAPDYPEDMKVVNNTIHIVGRSGSSDFPVTNGSALNGTLDVVYLKLNAGTGATVFSAYYGGSDIETGMRLAVEGNNVHIVGTTLSSDFPVTNGSTFKGGDRDVFYLQINHTTGAINVASLVGGSGSDAAAFLDVVGTNVFVGGNTRSVDLPVTDGSTYIGPGSPPVSNNPFYVKLNATNGNILFGTYLIGSNVTNTVIQGRTRFTDMAVENGKVHFLFFTSYPDGITTNGSVYNNNGGSDPFALGDGYYVNFDQNSNALLTGTYLGGRRNENFSRFKVVGNEVHLVGTTSSPDIPLTIGSVISGTTGVYYKINATTGNLITGIAFKGITSSFDLDVVGTDVNILGFTNITDFPVTNNSVNNAINTNQNLIYIKINSNTGNILLASYIGGDGEVVGNTSRIFMDGDFAYISAQTISANFPVTFPGNTYGGLGDVSYVKLNLCPDFPAQASNALSPASQSVCVNGAVGQLTGPAVVIPSTALPLVYRNNLPAPQQAIEARYQWQEATAPGGPWADITGAVQRNYTPAPVVTNRYFRRLARQLPACGGAVVQTSEVSSILIGTNNAPIVNAGQSYVTCPGSPVTLTSTVTGGLAPYTYDWDQGAADVPNPSVSPTANTIYTLTVTDANGCVQLDQAIVNTYTADAGPTFASFCGGAGVRIGTAPIAGLAGVTYSWAPAAGLSCTDCAQPLASPAASTVYTLTMTIPKTDGTTCQTTDNITVNPVTGPTGQFAGPDVTVCLGQTALLGTPTQGFSYTWAPGNYLVSNDAAQVTYQPGNLSLPFPNPIQYYVTAFRSGCTFVDSTIVTSIEARADIDGCGPRSLGLPDRTPNLNETYEWVKISGPGTFTGPTNVPVTNVSASVGGDSEYELRVTLNGVTCTDRVIVPEPCECNVFIAVNSPFKCPTLNLNGAVTLQATGLSSPSIPPSSYIFTWSVESGPAGGLNTFSGPTVQLTDTQNRVLRVTLTSSANPNFQCFNLIEINNPDWSLPIFSAPDVSTCPRQPITIGSLPVAGYTYAWLPAQGLSDPNSSMPTASVTATTQYSVIVRDTLSGCEVGETVTVTANSVAANAGPDLLVCDNGVVTLGTPAIAGVTYAWQPANANFQNGTNASSAQPDVLVAINTTFILTTTLISGGETCTNADTVVVRVGNPITPFTLPDLTLCPSDPSPTLGLDAPTGLASYAWTPANALTTPTTRTTLINAPLPLVPTTYTLIVKNADGCEFLATQRVDPTVTLPDAGSNGTLCLGETITIGGANNPAGAGITYAWTGPAAAQLSSTTSPNPTFTPTAAGTFEFTLTKTENGCASTARVTIRVVSFTLPALPSPTVCAGTAIQIGTTPVVGVTYSWSPVANLSNPAIANPVVTGLTQTTAYTLTAIGANGCPATATIIVTVNPGPAPTVSVPAIDICLTLTNNTAVLSPVVSPAGTYTYQWSTTAIIDGRLSSPIVANPSVQFFAPGTQSYTLTVTDAATGCAGTGTGVVTARNSPNLTINNAAICLGQNATLTASGCTGGTLLWNTGASTSSITVNPTVTTNYTATCTLNGCVATANATVTVNPIPVVTIVGPDAICTTDLPVSYTASPAGGSFTLPGGLAPGAVTVTGNVLTINAGASLSSLSFNYTFTGTGNCVATATKSVTISNGGTPVNFTPATVCAGSTLTFTDPANTSGTFRGFGVSDTGSGATVNTTLALTQAGLTAPATFYVYYDQGAGLCVRTDSALVTVSPAPVVTIAGPSVVCATELPVTFTASPAGGTFTLPNGLPAGAVTQSGSTLTLNAGAGITSLTFSYRYTDAATTCSATASKTIVVNPTPIPTINAPASICFGDSTTLTVANCAGSILWSTAQTTASIVVNPVATTTYSVTCTVGDCDSTVSATVTVRPRLIIAVIGLDCSEDLTYSARYLILSGGGPGTIVTSNIGTVSASTGTVSGIPSGTTVILTATTAEGCVDTTSTLATCTCPIIAPPTTPNNPTICLGQPLPALTVVAPAGTTIEWYATSTGGTVLATGPSYTPVGVSSTTIYYAQARLTAFTPCVSERIPVTLTINPLPTITVGQSPVCSVDLLTYSVNFTASAGSTVTASAGTVSGSSVINIPAGTNVTLTATSAENCVATTTVTAPLCECPVVNPPTAPNSPAICVGQAIPALTVVAPAGTTIEWYATSSGGTVLATGPSYTPVGVTSTTIYYVQARSTSSVTCVSVRIPVTLTINPLPSITTASPVCSVDLLTYSVTFTASAGSTVTASAGTVSGSSIINIPAGTNVTLTATSAANCVATTTVTAPLCECPVVNPPTAPNSPAICVGQAIPALTVVAPAGTTIEWYATSSGGTVLATGPSYTPVGVTSTTIYYVQARSTSSVTCVSVRIPVTLTINPLPTITVGQSPVCSVDLLTYSVNFTASAGSTVTASAGTVSGGTVSGIPAGTNVTLTATTAAGCVATTTVTAPLCECPVVNPPTAPNSPAICVGQAIPALTVVAPAGTTIEWYATSSGGTVLATGASYTPVGVTSTTIYYAQAVSTASPTCVSVRIPVTLTISALPTITVGASPVCSVDLLTYSVNFTASAGGTVTASAGTVSGSSVINIPAGTSVTLTVTSAENCVATTTVTAPLCECPVVNPPTAPNSPAICVGQAIPALTVTGAAGTTVEWYATSTGGTVLATGVSYTPTTAGTYYAQAVSTASVTCVSVRIPVTLTISPLPTITVGASPVCSVDLLTYSVNFAASAGSTVTASAGTVSGGTVSGIPAGTNVTLTVTSAENCVATTTVTAPLCECPVVNPPTAPNSPSICVGQPIPALTVTAPAGTLIEWYATSTGGTVLATGPSYTPTTAGTYYAQAVSTASPTCVSVRIPVTLTINPLPTITVGQSPVCSTDLLTYSVDFTASAGSVVTASAGTISGGSVINIPAGTNVTLTATSAENCVATTTVTAPLCECPVVNPPTAPNSPAICVGQAIPALTVTAPAGTIIEWYATSSGGTVLATGPSYTPTTAGTYYAQAVSRASLTCVSVRIPVTLTINPLPTITVGQSPVCSVDLLTYTVNFTASAGSAVTASAGTVSGGSVINIPAGTNVTLTATSAENCVATTTVTAPLCECPVVNPPTAPNSPAICVGQAIPALTVTAPAGTIIEWYATSSGGTVLATGPSYTPVGVTSTTIYYVQARSTTSLTCVSVRIPVTLTINPLPTITVGQSPVCSVDLLTYRVNFTASAGSTVTASAGTVSGGSVINIPAGTNVTLTATSTDNCVASTSVTAPICTCPVIAPPTAPANASICVGQPIPALMVTGAAGTTVEWYATSTGGTVLATGVSYTPTTAGTYYAQAVSTASPTCVSVRIPVTLTINPLPTITVGQSPVCSTDLLTYSVDFTASAGSVVTASAGTISGGSVINIPAGTNVTLTATSAENCVATTTVTAPLCECPVVNPPTAPNSPAICVGQAIPALTVVAPAGTTIEWYATSTGGTVVATGPSYTPAGVSSTTIYYVQARSTTSLTCVSVRIPVTLTINPLPTITVGQSPVCSTDLLTYSVDFTASAGSVVTASAGTVSGGSVINIPAGTNVTLTATTAAGCVATTTVTAPICLPLPAFDLGLTKVRVGTGTVISGGALNYTITVSNQGNVPAFAVQVTDRLPTGLSLIAGGDFAASGANAVATIAGPIAPGASVSLTLTARVNAGFTGSSLRNVAEITAADNDTIPTNTPPTDVDSTPENDIPTEDDQDEVTVPITSVGSLGDFVWQDLNDNGQQDAGEPGVNGVKVILWRAVGGSPSVRLDSTITSGNGAYSFTNLPKGDYIVQIALASVPQGFTLSTRQNVGSDVTDSDFSAAGLSQVVSIDPTLTGINKDNPTIDAGLISPVDPTPIFDLDLTKVRAGSGLVLPGGALNYTITVSNQGNVPAYNIEVTDNLPAGLSLIAGDDFTATGANTAVAIIAGPLAPGASVSLTVTTRIDAGFTGSVLRNVAQITRGDNDTDSTNVPPVDIDSTPGNNVPGEDDQDDAVVPIGQTPTFDLSLTKSVSQRLAMLGDTLTYTIEVRNEGEGTAHGIEVTDVLNPGVKYISSVASMGSYSAATKKWSFDSITVGATRTLTVRVQVIAQGVWFNTAEITRMTEGDVDSTPNNGLEGEDDIAHACFTVPILICRGQGTGVSLIVPAQYTGVVWFRKVPGGNPQNGQPVQVGTGNTYQVTETELGSYEYTFTSTLGNCPADGCCPTIIVVEDCCPVDVCVPFVITKKKR